MYTPYSLLYTHEWLFISDPGYLYSFKIIVELVIDIFFGKTAQIWDNQSQKLSTESSKHSMKTAKLRILWMVWHKECMLIIKWASFSHTNNHFLSYFICDCRLTNILNALLTSLSMYGRFCRNQNLYYRWMNVKDPMLFTVSKSFYQRQFQKQVKSVLSHLLWFDFYFAVLL